MSVRSPLAILVLAAAAHAQVVSYVEHSAGLQQPGLEAGSTELEFADVNHDGHPDIISIGDHGNPWVNTGEHGVMVWFGDGAGNWSVFQVGEFGYGGIAAGDVNGDGWLDIGYGMHHNYSGVDFGNQLLEVALGNGTGQGWTPWDDGLATNGETWGMFATDFADVDHDGDLDLGAVSFGCCNGVRVYRNNGNGTWTQSFGANGGNSTNLFQFGDVNGDGHPDLVSGNSQAGGSVRLGTGTGSFMVADGNLPAVPSGGREGVALGDVNADGRDDLAFAPGSGARVYTWLAPGQWQDLSGNLTTIGAVRMTQIADMNLDGYGDLVALYLGQTRIYLGNGAGNWTLGATITTPAACDYAAFRAGTDVDHNGYPDFLCVLEENCSPWSGGQNKLRCLAEASVPTAYAVHAVHPRGGETWIAGSVRFIDWHAAIPAGAALPAMQIEFSWLGPDGPYLVVDAAALNNGRKQWRVPPAIPDSDTCFLRLTLASDPPVSVTTPAAFSVVNGGQPLAGDLDCSGTVDFADINPFVLALANPVAWVAAYPNCNYANGDVDGNGTVDFGDINPFVALLTR